MLNSLDENTVLEKQNDLKQQQKLNPLNTTIEMRVSHTSGGEKVLKYQANLLYH